MHTEIMSAKPFPSASSTVKFRYWSAMFSAAASAVSREQQVTPLVPFAAVASSMDISIHMGRIVELTKSVPNEFFKK